jgi:hypothetical protein
MDFSRRGEVREGLSTSFFPPERLRKNDDPGKNCEDNELPDEIVLSKRCRNAGSKEVLPAFFCLFLQNNPETKFQSRDLQYPPARMLR